LPSTSTTRTIPLSFDKLELSDPIRRALKRAGYEKPSPIQAGLIPLALEDLDIIGQAQTGTGKTAAFAIPILQRLDLQSKPHTQALILVPTRELCLQVAAEVEKLAHYSEATVAAVYGGRPLRQQVTKLNAGPHVVVGTPGRVIDHLKRKTLNPKSIWCVVLDEADRMLDIGFRPDIEYILRQMPEDRQTLLLSATVPKPILEIARLHMYSPKVMNLSSKNVAGDTIEQHYISTTEEEKFNLLLKLIAREEPHQAIIFCRTKIRTMRIFRQLSKKYGQVESIQGDLAQGARDRIMAEFRAGKVRYLVATDVMGRGIDVSTVSHIINYDLPEMTDDYVHRVGRTGRMGRDGVAYSFVTNEQGQILTEIEKRINRLLLRDSFDDETTEKAESKPVEAPSKEPKKYRRALSL
jgi:ATP-dependent RNA helicase DeaD